MSWWESAPLADAPASGGPQPLLDLRDPGKQQGLENDQTRTGIAVRGEQRDVNKTDFDQKGALYERYSKLPEVKTYRVAVQQLAQAIGTGDGPQADLALTYAFAKAMDPESVVRESEQGMVTGSQPWLETAAEKVKKQFGMDGAGLYTPETRNKIRAQIANAVAQRNKLYNQQRDYFTEIAKRNNFDPYEVVGEHDANPFAEKIRAWGREGQTPKPVETVNGFAKGTNVEVAGNDGPGFNRDSFLETLGLDNKKETVLMAGLNQITGNPNLTAEDMLNVYEQAGVPLPDAAAFKQQLDYARKGYRFGPIDTTAQEAAYKAKVDEFAQSKDNVTGAVESGFQGATQGLTFGFGDELGAGMTTLLEGGTYDQNLERERVMRDGYRQANPIPSYGAEVLSSVAIPMGVADTPLDLARIGGASGALYGMGSSDGDIADRIVSGGLGAGIGMVAAPAMGQVVNMAAPYVRKGVDAVSDFAGNMRSKAASDLPTVDAARVAQAGAEEGVPINRAMVAPELSNKVTAVESSMVGGPVVRGGMQQVSEGIENRVGNLSKGTALDPVIAGEKVQGAVKRADKDMKSEVDRLYDSYRKASGDPPVTPQTALSQVETELADLAKSPKTNAGEINYLTDLKSDLASGSMTVDTLLGLRRSMRGQIRERNLGMTQAEARVQRVLDAAGDDVAKALDPKSPAYAFLQRANKAHGERQVFKRQVVKELIGMDRDIPLDPDKAFKKLQQWSKPGADGSRLIATWKKFTPEEAADVAATIAEPLGRDKGGVFSPALFVSQVDQLSDRARVTAFGPEGKRSIDNLIELSNQFKRVQGAFNNSKSGVAINSSNAKQAALTVLGASGGGYAGGWTGAAVGASLAGMVMAKNLVSARALMSPNISKWLVGLSKKPNQPAALAHIARLENLAKAEPVIANEVLQLQSVLKDAFQQYPERLAAQEPEQGQGAAPQATQRTTGEPQ